MALNFLTKFCAKRTSCLTRVATAPFSTKNNFENSFDASSMTDPFGTASPQTSSSTEEIDKEDLGIFYINNSCF